MEFLSDCQAEGIAGGWFSIHVAPSLVTRVSPMVAPQVFAQVSPMSSVDVAAVTSSQLNLAVPTAVAVLGANARANSATMINSLVVDVSA